jgi:hypothetical protein
MADLKKDILDATEGGRIIFEKLFPFFHPRKQFKIEEDEQTPSGKAYFKDGVYYVKCFDPTRSKLTTAANCFDWISDRLHCEFAEAIKIAADMAGISAGQVGKSFEVISTKAVHTGFRVPGSKRKPTEMECRALGRYVTADACDRLSVSAIDYYDYTSQDGTTRRHFSSESRPVFFLELEGKIYSPREKEKQYRYMATGKMPDSNTTIWGLEQAQNELKICKAAYQQMKEVQDAEGEPGDEFPTTVSVSYDELADEPQTSAGDEKRKALAAKVSEKATAQGKKVKLNVVVVCCGYRDAINVMSIGYSAVWMSSEGLILPRAAMAKLHEVAHEIYYLADLDSTGQEAAHRNCSAYLDVRRIYLPEKLGEYTDHRGKACKDITDWLNHWDASDFKGLLETAAPYRFWITEWMKKGKDWKPKHKISRTWLKLFLQANGFRKYQFDDGKGYVHTEGNKVRQVLQEDIKVWVNQWAAERQFSREVRDMISGSRDMSETVLNELPEVTLDFNSAGHDYQLMFFRDRVWKITPETIEDRPHGKVLTYAWHHRIGMRESGQVLDPKIKSSRAFTCDLLRKKEPNADGTNSIVIDRFFSIESGRITINKRCEWFNFLINTARVHWKEEIAPSADTPMADIAKLQKQIIAADGWQPEITSEKLTDEQNADQQLHLINRIYTLGYLMHRHKLRNKAWLVWCMDNKVDNLKDSKGRSGKSMIPQAFEHLKIISTENGRDKNLTKKNHIFGDVTSLTDLLVINDCHDYLDLGFFFNYISDNLTVNPKNIAQRVIPFSIAGKIVVTSNYGPYKLDDSTMDRILFNLFSDWYHSDKEFGMEHKPSDEAGHILFDDWSADEWNLFYNFMAQCCQAYMTLPKCQAPMAQVLLRQNMREAGDTFMEFADEKLLPLVNPHFVADPEDPTMGGLIEVAAPGTKAPGAHVVRKGLAHAWRDYSGGRESITQNKLGDRVKAWAQARGIEVNPPQFFTPDEKGRVRNNRKIATFDNTANKTTYRSEECFYLWTPNGKPDVFNQILEEL